MNIACLGWGSLVWDPRELPIRGRWFDDGPILPIEFARKSGDGRITLVICERGTPGRTLWALMSSSKVDAASQALADREASPLRSIGVWTSLKAEVNGPEKAIGEWAMGKKLDAVVWTALTAGLTTAHDSFPSYEQVLTHLRSLPYEKRRVAEKYVCLAPQQIDTEYRRRLEQDLGWRQQDR